MKPGNVKCEGHELAHCFNFSFFLLSFIALHSHKVCMAVKGESKDNHLHEKQTKCNPCADRYHLPYQEVRNENSFFGEPLTWELGLLWAISRIKVTCLGVGVPFAEGTVLQSSISPHSPTNKRSDFPLKPARDLRNSRYSKFLIAMCSYMCLKHLQSSTGG